MLPFLKNKDQSIAGLIIKQRSPDKPAQEPVEPMDDTGIEECAKALIKAVHNNDVKGVAQAMKDAFIILEAQEDESEDEDNSYAAQNIKAAKQENEG